jgi:hypothetical protein
MTSGEAGAGSTNVGQAGEESVSEIFLQVLVTSFSGACTLYTAKVLSLPQYSWQVAYRISSMLSSPPPKASTDAYGETLRNHSKSPSTNLKANAANGNQTSPAKLSAAETVDKAYATSPPAKRRKLDLCKGKLHIR